MCACVSIYVGRKVGVITACVSFQGSGIEPDYKHNQRRRFLFLKKHFPLLYKITKMYKMSIYREPRPDASDMYSHNSNIIEWF